MSADRPKDILLWLCPVLLWGFGLLGLWSLSRGQNYPLSLVYRQLAAGALGLIGGWLCTRLRWAQIARFVPWAAGGTVLALLAVLVVGSEVNGATRWLQLPGVGGFQPSEPAKLVGILLVAQLVSRLRKPLPLLSSTLGVVAVLAGLIFLQPDLGTCLVLTATCIGVLFLGGAPWAPLLGIAGLALAALPNVLSPYQWQRLQTFFHPEADPSGAGWNLEQSKIALGSGGLWGTGPFQGLQGPLDFLPEAHSDFIFAALGEELGFVGCATLLLITATLVSRLMWLANKTEHTFARLVLAGIALHFALHALLNTGMTIGLAPVTGSPLPFVSFGGTALVTNFLAIGIAQSAKHARRF